MGIQWDISPRPCHAKLKGEGLVAVVWYQVLGVNNADEKFTTGPTGPIGDNQRRLLVALRILG